MYNSKQLPPLLFGDGSRFFTPNSFYPSSRSG
nr:MAG TPA: hypothetical protein [Caudoviricetes sp.]